MTIKNIFRRHGRKIAAGLIAVFAGAAALPLSLRADVQNRHFEQCIATHIAGNVDGLTVKDQLGQPAVAFPVLRENFLHEAAGFKRGAYILDPSGAGNHLLFQLNPQDGKFVGAWDFPRVAGVPLPTGTWGRGEIAPTARQKFLADTVSDCANNAGISHTTRWF